MIELPKTITETKYICVPWYGTNDYSPPTICDTDMSGTDWLCLGEVEVTVDVPQDANILAITQAKLEDKRKEAVEKCQKTIDEIDGQLAELRALTVDTP